MAWLLSQKIILASIVYKSVYKVLNPLASNFRNVFIYRTYSLIFDWSEDFRIKVWLILPNNFPIFIIYQSHPITVVHPETMNHKKIHISLHWLNLKYTLITVEVNLIIGLVKSASFVRIAAWKNICKRQLLLFQLASWPNSWKRNRFEEDQF